MRMRPTNLPLLYTCVTLPFWIIGGIVFVLRQCCAIEIDGRIAWAFFWVPYCLCILHFIILMITSTR